MLSRNRLSLGLAVLALLASPALGEDKAATPPGAPKDGTPAGRPAVVTKDTKADQRPVQWHSVPTPCEGSRPPDCAAGCVTRGNECWPATGPLAAPLQQTPAGPATPR